MSKLKICREYLGNSTNVHDIFCISYDAKNALDVDIMRHFRAIASDLAAKIPNFNSIYTKRCAVFCVEGECCLFGKSEADWELTSFSLPLWLNGSEL